MADDSRIPLFDECNDPMSCHRCHGLMHPMDLLIGASGSGHDGVCGWRCVSCGEIVDQVILQNRIRARGRRFARREKRPRQPVRMTPDFWPARGHKGPTEVAMDEFVPICCFCSKVRDDTDVEAGRGPWIDLSIYALRWQFPLSQEVAFTHGYCPDCVAHYDERLLEAYRSNPVSASLKSLKEAERRLMAKTGRGQRNNKR